jgi:ribosomal protein L37E
MPKQCNNCRWFDDQDRTRGHYVCRRYPPAYYDRQEKSGSHSGFPFVRSFDWCGEWTWTEEAEQAHNAHLKKVWDSHF